MFGFDHGDIFIVILPLIMTRPSGKEVGMAITLSFDVVEGVVVVLQLH